MAPIGKWPAKKWLQLLIVIAAAAVLLLMPSPLPGNLLTNDFQAYWSASRLLSLSENFTDPDLLLQLEQQHAGFEGEFPLLTWNPPWFLAWFLPFAITSFSKASWLWFLANIILVFASTVMLWQTFASRTSTMRRLWLGLIISFTFLPTLTALLVGQIAALTLLGIAAFLWFEHRRQPFWAGMALALATVKPHVVYLVLTLILLELVFRKQWRTVLGFCVPLVSGTILALILRPTFLLEYGALMTRNRIIYRITVPTPPSYLAERWDLPWLQYIGLVVLLASVVVWWRTRQRHGIDMVQLVVVGLIASQLTTAYGWSFDFILFLVPVLQVAVWSVESRIPKIRVLALGLALVAANVIFFHQRSLHVQDKELVWFPIVLSLLYGWAWWSFRVAQEGVNQSGDGLPARESLSKKP